MEASSIVVYIFYHAQESEFHKMAHELLRMYESVIPGSNIHVLAATINNLVFLHSKDVQNCHRIVHYLGYGKTEGRWPRILVGGVLKIDLVKYMNSIGSQSYTLILDCTQLSVPYPDIHKKRNHQINMRKMGLETLLNLRGKNIISSCNSNKMNFLESYHPNICYSSGQTLFGIAFERAASIYHEDMRTFLACINAEMIHLHSELGNEPPIPCGWLIDSNLFDVFL